MKIEKEIKEITKDGNIINAKNNKLMKVEIVGSKIAETEVTIKYSIKVTNTGKIDGKADIEEIVPQGFKVDTTNPSYWEEQEGKLTTNVELKVGESKELEVVLKWMNTEFGVQNNKVKLSNISNEANFEDINKEDNSDNAELILSIKTGSDINAIVITIISALVMAEIALLLIKKITVKKDK